MNVLHVTPSMSPTWGGPVIVVSELTAALENEGIHCEIATTRGYRVGADIAGPEGIQTHVFDTGPAARLWTAYSRDLARFLNDGITRFDLIHIHEIWHYAGYAAFRAAKKNAVPCVITVHGELSEWSLRHKGWKKFIYRKAILDNMLRKVDSLHTITLAEKDRIASLGCDTPVTVAPNGIDPTPYDNLPDPSGFLDRFPALRGKRVILFLGRLNPTKGLDVLARSFSNLKIRFPDAILLMAGPDEEGARSMMESILKSQGNLDSAVFTGMLTGTEKLAAMSCADIFVLPSYSEGFSIAILEAMAARLPLVITKGCNFPEVAEHNAGFVVEASETPVTEAIAALLADDALRSRMGERGRKLVTERYTWQAAASKIADLYRSLAIAENTKTPV